MKKTLKKKMKFSPNAVHYFAIESGGRIRVDITEKRNDGSELRKHCYGTCTLNPKT